jgi:hypothetical protein
MSYSPVRFGPLSWRGLLEIVGESFDDVLIDLYEAE